MSVRIPLNPPQSRVMRAVAPGRTVVLAFGRGVGKSWFIRRLCYLLVAQWENKERATSDGTVRGIRVVFLLPTFKQFRDVHSRAMLNELAETFAFLGGKVDKTTFSVTFPGGSTIQVFPASEHGGQRARGIRADVVLLDEADDVDISVYDGVVRPWFTEPWSLKIKIVSGTPKRGRHGLLYRLFSAGKTGDKVRGNQPVDLPEDRAQALTEFYSVHATYRDAPNNVDQREVEQARATMPEATFSREYECNFDAGEGLVYAFDESFHVREPPDFRLFPTHDLHVGMDHGWTDPGVMLLGGVIGHGNDAALWILDEHYETEVPNSVWNQRATAWKFAKFWPDPSRPDRINDLRTLSIDCGDSDNDILAGISRVADLLHIRTREDGSKFARLYVSPRCVNTIREFGLYRRRKLSDGTFDEKPEDKNNHALDSLRYLCVGRFGRPQSGRHVTSGR